MDHTKSSIRKLLIEGDLEAATDAALEYADYTGLDNIAKDLILLGSRASNHHQQWSTGLISYADFSLGHAQITKGLTDLLDRLPDEPKPAGPRKKFITEANFKRRIFILLVLIKVFVLLRLFYHWSTGGFNDDQLLGTATLLAPALAAYIAVVLDDYIRQHKAGPQPARYISGPLVTFGYWLFPVYALVLIFFIEMKAKSSITFTQMNLWLALVESMLGGYVGQLVHGLFKKNDGSL